MTRIEVRDLGEPETVVTYPLGASSQVRLGAPWSRATSCSPAGAGRSTLSPWSAPPHASSTHIAARILAEAEAGEVLVSGGTRDLAEGATGLTFDSRGSYRLKGLEREHELFAAGSSAEAAPA